MFLGIEPGTIYGGICLTVFIGSIIYYFAFYREKENK